MIPLVTRLVGIVLCAACAAAGAQTFSAKPVRIVVPFAPGGTSDVLARLLGPRLGDALGTTVVVENKPGANGNIGAEQVAKSAPDGHSLVLMDVGNLAISPAIFPKLPFSVGRDFAPVTLISYTPHLLVVRPDLGVARVADLIAMARAHPGKLNYATTGLGSAPHMAGLLLAVSHDLKWVDISGKGGADSIMHVMSGQADLLFNGMVATLPHVKSGKLRLLAVSSEKRVAALPEVPTVAEATGAKNFVTGSWQGLLAPAGTPKPALDRLQAEIARLFKVPEVAERLAALGADPVGNRPEEMAAWLGNEMQRWSEVVRRTGFRLEQ
ncbi:MAG: tripartite tricarboxylate transporter substrate binding protein [Burkholderiales bacterium]|nr:tripartite tricarboxylate transporter substrate binding protein [Burkholderiales bacterium]